MKYILLCFLLPAVSLQTFGQRKSVDNLSYFDDRPLHFGFYLGLNTMDYRIRNYQNVFDNPVLKYHEELAAKAHEIYNKDNVGSDGIDITSFEAEVYSVLPGFTVGGVLNLRMARDFDFRFTPGMSLGSRSFKYFINLDKEVTQRSIADEQSYLTTPSAYVDLPVGIRYKGFRHYNLRPYVYLGVAYRYDLENKRIAEGVVHLNKGSSYAELGLGLDSYLEYFRFTAEFRFSYGLSNIIRHDTVDPIPYYGFIFKELNSNIFTLIFYFE